jgi:hypothetical protein
VLWTAITAVIFIALAVMGQSVWPPIIGPFRELKSIPLGPFQQWTFVVLRNCCSLESFSRWAINLASCRHTAGFVL